MSIALTENLAGEETLGGILDLDLDRALDELDQISAEQRELVEMKFFAGLSVREIADLMEISNRTAWRHCNAPVPFCTPEWPRPDVSRNLSMKNGWPWFMLGLGFVGKIMNRLDEIGEKLCEYRLFLQS